MQEKHLTTNKTIEKAKGKTQSTAENNIHRMNKQMKERGRREEGKKSSKKEIGRSSMNCASTQRKLKDARQIILLSVLPTRRL
mmetsp:Transcript_41180/g.81198  ORF Transcript_41180/g.81198 Transcript_41180/m.81198 type:complete len:83 (+) Transcript_41180:272-520(+)